MWSVKSHQDILLLQYHETLEKNCTNFVFDGKSALFSPLIQVLTSCLKHLYNNIHKCLPTHTALSQDDINFNHGKPTHCQLDIHVQVYYIMHVKINTTKIIFLSNMCRIQLILTIFGSKCFLSFIGLWYL